MKTFGKNRYIRILLIAAILTTGACLTALVLLRSLSDLTGAVGVWAGLTPGDAETAALALEGLKDAEIRLPLILVFVAACLMLHGIVRFKRRAAKIIAVVLTIVILPLLSIWFTKVNRIQVGDVLTVGNHPFRYQSAVTQETDVWHTVSAENAADGSGAQWTFGFGASPIVWEEPEQNPLYIAGYDAGRLTSQYLENSGAGDYDYGQARAVWMDAGGGGVLLIGVDCVALSGHFVERIREELKEYSEQRNCVSVNVYATHSHAMPDTLGLWGPLGIDGKNDDYMEKLVDAAVEAGRQALSTGCAGELYYGSVTTPDELLRDSRYPLVYDAKLHQLRFEGEDGFGVRLFFYGAHAEAMRGANKLLSRDFPGVLCDLVTAETGDHTLFLPGAIGGLIMTQELTAPFDAAENMRLTGRILADYALSITPDTEQRLEPDFSAARTQITVPLDNNAFLYYQFLGILQCNAIKAQSRTGYAVRSEMSLLQIGDLAICLIPGEIFPELVYGGKYGFASSENENPTPLAEMAAAYGVEQLLIVGLANEELGYIVPPSDYLVHKTNPYLQKTMDYLGENHYEETNSVGPECAAEVAAGFQRLLEALK